MKAVILGTVAALAALTASAATSARQPAAPGLQAFVGARLYDGTNRPAIDRATIIVRDGRVEAVGPSATVRAPAGARTIDLAGKVVLPGLISTHVHVSDVQGTRPRVYTDENTRRQLGVFARYGVTTVWSLGGEQEPAFRLRDTQNTAALDRARIYVAGEVIVGKTPEEARQMVAKVAAQKPDVIKIRVDDNLGTAPKMPPDVYRAVIDEAHRRGLRVAVHVFYLADTKDVLRAGADIIAHSVRDADIDEELIALMKGRNVPYCPTLTRELSTFVYASTPAFFSDPFFLKEADPGVVEQLKEPARQEAMQTSASAQRYKAALEVARRNLVKAANAGVSIVMGTDAGPFPERFQGYFEHVELEMMVESGLSPAQALRAATGDASKAMKLTDLGTIAKGSWADLLVLDADPMERIQNTRKIHSVWMAGNEVGR